MGTSNLQLENYIRILKIRNFRAVLMKDELQKFNPLTNECFIINLENSDQNGSHWISIWKKGRDCEYFDSYGTPIPQEVKDYYRKYKIKSFQSNSSEATEGKLISTTPNEPIQKYQSDSCGELSVLFLLLCQKRFSFEEVMNLLAEATSNT